MWKLDLSVIENYILSGLFSFVLFAMRGSAFDFLSDDAAFLVPTAHISSFPAPRSNSRWLSKMGLIFVLQGLLTCNLPLLLLQFVFLQLLSC